jgi:DNA-3-methyladenine glycosylase II
MWFDELDGAPDWKPAVRLLKKTDPVMAELVRKVGPCTLSPRPDPFLTLVGAIFSQQLSTKGAMTLLAKFRDRFPQRRPTPPLVLEALNGNGRAWDGETIRACGISRQKRAYLIDLCERLMDRRLELARLHKLEDEAVIEELSAVRGIGVWTSQMYLMFTLCRPDVLPVADLGIQESARRHYNLRGRPSSARLTKLAVAWRPWRTVACWYLWRGLEG